MNGGGEDEAKVAGTTSRRKLSELAAGESAIVCEIPKNGASFVRIREMGMLVGTPIRFIRTAPLGDPIEISVRGYNLSLKRREAEQVIVEVQGGSDVHRLP